MLKNYFRIAIRTLGKNKTFAFLNILGLAIGISACLLIFIVTSFEFSFDRFHPDNDRIFRVVTKIQNAATQNNAISTVPDPAAKVIRSSVSGLESVAMFHIFDTKVAIPEGDRILRRFFPGGENRKSSPIILTEPQYFDIFNYEWLQGNKATALSEPFRVVLSENEARKYFGSIPLDEVMGREIIYADSLRLRVSGIVKDWTQNTDFRFKDFISYSTIQHSFLKYQGNWDNWGGYNDDTQVFTKLAGHATPEKINSQFAKIVKDNLHSQPGTTVKFLLQPLSEIHFNGDFQDSYTSKAHLLTLYGLMAIAVFILIIAAINFINFSTAQSIQRAKEIGIRKVLGSSRRSIILQFLCEIFLITLLATVLSVLVMKPLIYLFHDLLPQGADLIYFNSPTALFLLLLTVATSLLAGFYPAKILSGYLPVISLKGGGAHQINQRGNLRKGLIIFQFTVSMLFIISTLIIGNQIRFMLNKDMGFAKDAVINVNTDWHYPGTRVKVFADLVKGLPEIRSVSRNQGPPATVDHNGTSIAFNDTKIQTEVLNADENYVPLYQLKIIAGRNIVSSDTIRELLINTSCARDLGFSNPEDAVGKLVDFGWSNSSVKVRRPIVGVVADFHSSSLHDPIKPVALVTGEGSTLGIKLISQNINSSGFQSAVQKIAGVWEKVYPNDPFEYQILDDQIAKFYDSYRKTNHIMNVAMAIAIFISCMGLFGLAAYTAEQRRKEIGIRKVLGASVTGIVAMLSKDFLKLVLLSLAIASPFAWYFMNQWLHGFAYRIDMSWWIFPLAGTGALFIALATVSFHAINAAFADPVKSLRSE